MLDLGLHLWYSAPLWKFRANRGGNITNKNRGFAHGVAKNHYLKKVNGIVSYASKKNDIMLK